MSEISVIIPCYNQGKYIAQTLQSILDQTYMDWECIIINDGSTDNSGEIAGEWCKKDPRFKLIEKTNGGRSVARNIGIKVAQGAFIQLLDSDDLLAKEKFALSMSEYDKDKTLNLIISNFQILDDKTQGLLPPFCILRPELFNYQGILLEWDKDFNIPIHCPLIKKDLLEDFSFNQELAGPEDWLMWIHIFSQKVNFKYIDQPLAVYRFHETNTFANDLHMGEQQRKAHKYIFENLLRDEYRIPFYNRTLERWENESQKVKGLRDSTSFKLGSKIVNVAKSFQKK